MADRVQFELVSPERLLFSEMVEMVVIPGSEGNFGVLPGHAPFISTIRPGMIEVYEGRQVARRLFVAGGLAEVTPERCTVLADAAMPPEALDRGTIEAELQTLDGNWASLRDRLAAAAGADRERLAVEMRTLERDRAVLQAELQVLGEAGR